MIHEFRMQLKLIRYGSNLKSSIGAAVFFFLIGMLFLIMDTDFFVIGSIYIFFGPLMLLQVENTLLSCGSVTASPRRRILETWLPDILGFILGICCYVFLLIIAFIRVYFTMVALHYEEFPQQYGKALLFAGLMGGWILIYCGVAWKSFLISVVAFGSGFYVILHIFNEAMVIDLGFGALTGFLAVVLGAVFAGILRRLFYKKPISKYSMGANLRKQM